MSFEDVAKNIVWNSINSAICVDNAFVEPYAPQGKGGDEKTPRLLYESFRNENCSLNVYKYTTDESWSRIKDFVLLNHDLLILDWELGNDSSFKEALCILREAVEEPSLLFVLIYTQNTDIGNIKLNINSFFDRTYSNETERNDIYNQICEHLDDNTEIDDANVFFRKMANEVKDCIIAPVSKQREMWSELFSTKFQDLYDGEDFGTFRRELIDQSHTHLGGNIKDLLKFITYFCLNSEINVNGDKIDINQIEGVLNSFLMNNTLVSIFSKQTAGASGESVISPELVYTTFAEIIYKRPRNFLTLLALEMKNIYRDNSTLIGQELFDIHDVAFFHHQQSLETKEDFHNFLRNCWQNQLSELSYVENPKLFSVLDEYKTRNDIENEITRYKNEKVDEFRKELIKLNFNYSFITSKRKPNDHIRFGDIFTFTQNGEEDDSVFLLCITPHCDCLNPSNIRNKFYFVKGNKYSMEKGLDKPEEEFYSFLKHNKEYICIKWENKPFTLYIPDGINDISEKILVLYHKTDHFLRYCASQKENYTQRIANNAFSHAVRVGVELANYKLAESSPPTLWHIFEGFNG